MRKNEVMVVVDVETAGGLENPLCYDCGIGLVDKKGKFYEQFSLVVYNIYAVERELMKSAYYADKLPLYELKLKNGERKMVSFYYIKKLIADLMEKYNTKVVCAYNMNFDRRALNNTQRFTTDNRFKWFFPYDTEFHCIWHMACQVLMARPSYIKFALENGFVSDKGNILTNAECCYRYLTKDTEFKEQHEGLDDVKIEAEIMAACYRQHKKMKTEPYSACWRLVQKRHAEMETEKETKICRFHTDEKIFEKHLTFFL